MVYEPKAYNHFRYIAYEVPTGAPTNPGEEFDESKYLAGNAAEGYLSLQGGSTTDSSKSSTATSSADDSTTSAMAVRSEGPSKKGGALADLRSEDARTRLKRMAAVVDYANDQLRALEDNDKTLKIFTVPEFYFRPKSKASASGGTPESFYSEVEAQTLVHDLRQIFSHGAFEHWLFLPGTIVWKCLLGSGLDTSWIVRNSAVLVKGGSTEAPFTVADKENYSDGDLIDSSYHPKSEPRLRTVVGSPEERRKFLKEIDGIRFGMEICKDHSINFHVLKSTRANLADRDPAKERLDFHLLVAAGNNLVETSVAADKGSYILRNDGSGSPGYQPFAELGGVTRFNLNDIRELDRKIHADPRAGGGVWIPSLERDGVELTSYEPKIERSLAKTGWSSPTANVERVVPLPEPLRIPVSASTEERHPQRLSLFRTLPIASSIY